MFGEGNQNKGSDTTCLFPVSSSWAGQSIPPSFTKKLSKKDKILGSSIHMECKVSGSLPITAKWYKDGKEITDSMKYRSLCHENTVSLDVNSLELVDSANYTCSVTNVAGSDSCSAVLTVKGLEFFLSSFYALTVINLFFYFYKPYLNHIFEVSYHLTMVVYKLHFLIIFS